MCVCMGVCMGVCMCVCACVCVHVCVYVCAEMCVCQMTPLSYPEISAIPLQLSLKINFLKQKQDRSIVSTLVFQYFGLGKAHSSPLPKL